MTPASGRPALRRRKGCLVALLFVAGVLVFAFNQIGEPGRRARHVRQSIHPGMNVGDVESLLTGRYYCNFEMKRSAGWEGVSRDEFLAASGDRSVVSIVPRRIVLRFMGPSPLRVSFAVEFDERGLVSGVTEPRGSD